MPFCSKLLSALPNIEPRLGVGGHLAHRREETSYLRYLTHQGVVPVDWGNRAEFDNRTALTALYRNRDSVTGFTGGRCEKCGTVQFPSTRICVNPECREFDTQEPVSLSGCERPGEIVYRGLAGLFSEPAPAIR